MNDLQFTVTIHAPKDKVWDTLWRDETFREWANIIDPGTYMVGDLKVGNDVQFISSVNGYGVTSFVEELIAGEFLLLRHRADTQQSGKQSRENEWTGGTESYKLVEQDGATLLTATFDVPPEQKDYFQANYPKALRKVKLLAER